MIKEKTKVFLAADLNRLELTEALKAISSEIELNCEQEEGSDEVTVTVSYPEEFETEILALADTHLPTKTEEETIEEKATEPTERFKKLFIKTLQGFDATERAQFKAFIEGL